MSELMRLTIFSQGGIIIDILTSCITLRDVITRTNIIIGMKYHLFFV